MSNSSPWDIHSSLHRNPSTATGASMFSSYFPHRYDSRRSIASTVVGPPPLSPRTGPPPSAGPSSASSSTNPFHHLRQSAGSPWPIASVPSSPAPAPPPPVQPAARTRRLSGQGAGPSPLSIPGGGGIAPGAMGRVSPIAPRTPIQQQRNSPNLRQPSRAAMEQEFTQKHAQLVDQAKLLLAEMQTLQILGPIHGLTSSTTTTTTITTATTHSDDGSSSYFPNSDDASSVFSNTNNNTSTAAAANSNMAAHYEQDEVAMSSLSSILAGKLGSVVSKPAPRPARAVARQIISRLGPASTYIHAYAPHEHVRSGDLEGEEDVIELLMEDYEAVLDWARSAGSAAAVPPVLLSSGSSAVSSASGQGQAKTRVQRYLSERQALLEAALPAHLARLCGEAMMHFGHEKMYAPSVSRVPTPSVRSGVNGNGNGNGVVNGSLGVNGYVSGGGRERGGAQQFYANSQTFRNGTPIEEIPRHRFMMTDDGYAWDMLELASELKSGLVNSTGRGGMGDDERAVQLRNPVTRGLFTPGDVSKILAHPMGRSLVPSPPAERSSPSPAPSSPMPLPPSVSSLADNQGEQTEGGLRGYQGEYQPQLFGHGEVVREAEVAVPAETEQAEGRGNDNEINPMRVSWPSPLAPGQPPPLPYSVTPEPSDTLRSSSPPPPPPPSSSYPTATATPTSRDRDFYLPEPTRSYSPPSSPPPLLSSIVNGAANSPSQPQQPQEQGQGQQVPEPIPPPIPTAARRLPGSYPTTWEEQENDEMTNTSFSRNSRYWLSGPSPAPSASTARPPTTAEATDNETTEAASPEVNFTTAPATASNTPANPINNNPSTGGEYRSPFMTSLTSNSNNNRSPPPLRSSSPSLQSFSASSAGEQHARNYGEGGTRIAGRTSPGFHRGDRSSGGGGGGYWASQFLVATPPPSGPIPVSSLGDGGSSGGSCGGNSYQFGGGNSYQFGGSNTSRRSGEYPFPSGLGRVQHQQQQQQGEQRGRENGAAEHLLTNPFASSRDNSPYRDGWEDGPAELDAGPFELDNTPMLTLGLGNMNLAGNSEENGRRSERDDDADLREWMGTLSSV